MVPEKIVAQKKHFGVMLKKCERLQSPF